MIRHLLLGVILVSCLSLPQTAPAQDLQSSVVGVWKLSSITRTDPQSGEVTNSYGEQPVGYLVYTKAGRVFAFLVGSDRKPPDKAEPSDSERAELFKSMVGYTGTYRVEGGKVIVRADASWNQSWTGVDRTQMTEVVGNRLTITATVKSSRDGREILTANVWERVE
jgi:Lipocalin-like domain